MLCCALTGFSALFSSLHHLGCVKENEGFSVSPGAGDHSQKLSADVPMLGEEQAGQGTQKASLSFH